MFCNEREFNWAYFKPENFYPIRYICLTIQLCRVDVVQNINFPQVSSRLTSQKWGPLHAAYKHNVHWMGIIARDAAQF